MQWETENPDRALLESMDDPKSLSARRHILVRARAKSFQVGLPAAIKPLLNRSTGKFNATRPCRAYQALIESGPGSAGEPLTVGSDI
eukprot:1097597-Prorocentrum_minimum.AAC.2